VKPKLSPRELIAMAVLSGALAFASWRGWFPVPLTETLGFVTGASCVYLVVREHIWNFPLGIANNVFFFVLFSEARLYGDAGLQIIYLGLAVHGWYFWLHGGKNRTQREVGHASAPLLLVLAGLVALGTVGLTLGLRAAGGSAPVLDAFTTVLSLAAQWLLNRKAIENWYVWMTADVLYIYLYVSRQLYLTAVLYTVFLALCVAGLLAWRRSLARQSETAAAGIAA
jgi:nicotinamide mononucleotide transporter